MSSRLFNLFIEKVFEEINERKAGTQIQEYYVITIRFVDDTAILGGSQKKLEKPSKSTDSKQLGGARYNKYISTSRKDKGSKRISNT